ncbi:MAG: fibronectin type III domain-containing protein [Bacteroidota bacterium]
MFNTILFVMGWLLMAGQPVTQQLNCASCQAVTNLQSLGQLDNSLTLTWDDYAGATNYSLMYNREEDGYTSNVITTGNNSYTFTDLPPGHYEFLVRADCGLLISSFIGVEDIIE